MIEFFKKYARVVFCFVYLMYDFYRFYRYSGWRKNYDDKSVRNYALVKIYHALEKSLSLKQRNKQSGANHCWSLYSMLNNMKSSGSEMGFHDRVAINVLGQFVEQIDGIEKPLFAKLLRELKHESLEDGGIKKFSSEDFKRGQLDNPSEFFATRYSLREFGDKDVTEEVIREAISLAVKAPSVCNRQPWHVYEIKDKDLLDYALSLQNGNRGFGHNLRHVLIITSDVKAFFSSKERYQHWIDGGIFSMSLIMALHSIGVASCCLNWSQDAKNDLALRRKIAIKDEHSVIMMLAIGYPDTENTVCSSPRRPVDEFYTIL